MTVYLVVLLSVLNSIGQRGSKVAVSLYALELGVGPFTVALLAAMFAASPLLLAVHAGRISDRAGVRTWMSLGAALIVLLHMALFPGHVRYAQDTAKSALDLLANAALRRTLIMSGFTLTGSELFAFYLPIYGRAIGLSPAAIGMILSSYALAGFIVRALMHRLAKRFTEAGVLTGSLFLAAIAYVAVPALTDGALLALAAFALGLALGSAQPLTILLTYNHAPKGRSGEALGMRIMAHKVT